MEVIIEVTVLGCILLIQQRLLPGSTTFAPIPLEKVPEITYIYYAYLTLKGYLASHWLTH